MNIYLENAGFWRNFTTVNRCCKTLPTSEPLHFHLICRRGLSPLHLYLLTSGKKNIATITLRISVGKLTPSLVRLCNASNLLGTVILVDRPLTQRQWRRIRKLNGILRIVDTSTSANEALYDAERRVVYQKGGTDTLRMADIYHLTASDKAIYQCHYSSCLGKTLLIRKDGSVCFCPSHPEKSRLGTLEDLGSIFESPVFYQTLASTVAKRRGCKQNCPHFEKCKGGCPFENDCDTFPGSFTAALADRDDIIAREADLSELPLYKELAVLRHLCDVVPCK